MTYEQVGFLGPIFAGRPASNTEYGPLLYMNSVQATTSLDANTLATMVGMSLKANVESPTFTGTVSGITKSMVGLGNVDNTADVDKTVSHANTAGSVPWTGITSKPTTVSGFGITDVVSEVMTRGSNSNGSWVRFNDGTQICYLNISVTNQAINNTYGSLFQGTRTWTFPQEFSEAPAVHCSLFKWGTSASWGTIGGEPTTTSVVLRGIDVNSRATGTACSISAIAIGSWS